MQEIKPVFREFLMRGKFTFPETEQDNEHWNEGLKPHMMKRFWKAALKEEKLIDELKELREFKKQISMHLNVSETAGLAHHVNQIQKLKTKQRDNSQVRHTNYGVL